MRINGVIAAAALSVALVAGSTTVAQAAGTAPVVETLPASGTFSFTTANGILPTWGAEDIVIVGVSPGSVVTAASNLTARVRVPIIAKTGTANAAAGGFRLINTTTGANVRCSNPTIDTRARVVDCVLPDGTNAKLFRITDIRTRSFVTGSSTITSIFRGVQLRINGQVQADSLNKALSTTAFSPYVNVGTGDLIVTRDL
jgi:hypothetical protein